jgi:hypothetical protein
MTRRPLAARMRHPGRHLPKMSGSGLARIGPRTSANDRAPSRVRRRSVPRALELPARDSRDVNATQQCRVFKLKPLKRGPVALVGEGRVVVSCPHVLRATDQQNHGRSVGLSPQRTVVAIFTWDGSMGCLSLRPAPTRLTALAGAASQPHEVASMTVAASWSGSAVSERRSLPAGVCAGQRACPW